MGKGIISLLIKFLKWAKLKYSARRPLMHSCGKEPCKIMLTSTNTVFVNCRLQTPDDVIWRKVNILCVCLYIYIYTHTLTHTYTHIHTHTLTHTHTHTHTYTLTHTHTHIHTYTYTHIHTLTHTRTYTHTYKHKHIHVLPERVTKYVNWWSVCCTVDNLAKCALFYVTE